MPRRRLPEPFTFFVDECLGAEVVPAALRDAVLPLESVVVHRDRFPQGVDDELWITEVASEGWVAITKDARLRYRPNERDAILRAGAAVMMVGNGRGEDLARTHARSALHCRRFAVPCACMTFRASVACKAAERSTSPVRMESSFAPHAS